jgi:hypothetical protein
MNKLFTPIGEDWDRLWYPYHWRMEADDWRMLSFNDPLTIEQDLKRCEKIGNYFVYMRHKLFSHILDTRKKYASNGKNYRHLHQLLDDALPLYKFEVGQPSKALEEFLVNKRKIQKCIRYSKDVHLLREINYFHCCGSVEVPGFCQAPLSLYEDSYSYSYPIYRLDKALLIIGWIKNKLSDGVSLADIHYCQYHGDSYPGEYVVRDYSHDYYEKSMVLYREEVVRYMTTTRSLTSRIPTCFLN